MTTKFNAQEKAKELYNRIRFIPDRVTLYDIEQDFKDAYDAGKLDSYINLETLTAKYRQYKRLYEEIAEKLKQEELK